VNKIQRVRALLQLAKTLEGTEAKVALQKARQMIERYEILPWELGAEADSLRSEEEKSLQRASLFDQEPWRMHFELQIPSPREAWRKLLMATLGRRLHLEMRFFSCVVLRSKDQQGFEAWKRLYRLIEGRLLEAVRASREAEREARCERLVTALEHPLLYLPEDRLACVPLHDLSFAS
jgi:hypothetical protein